MAYEPRKAAQLIAALILKNGGRDLDVLKAVKLVYLIDRESIKKYGYPVLDEPRVSMRLGPVNSCTYDFIKGEIPYEDTGWADFVTDKENHEIGLADEKLGLEDLDELSESDIECLDAVWGQHGNKEPLELRNWTHDRKNIPEWQDPNGGSVPIDIKSIFEAVGVPNAAEMAEQYEEMQALDRVFAKSKA